MIPPDVQEGGSRNPPNWALKLTVFPERGIDARKGLD